MQTVASGAAYEPMVQGSQGVDGSLSVSAEPAGHGWHDVCAEDAKKPALHVEQAVAESESRSAVPAGQLSQLVVVAKLPESHATHVVAESRSWS